MSTETKSTRPEHMFEPDGFPTRVLFVILAALSLALFLTFILLVAFFEISAQAEIEAKSGATTSELTALRDAEARELNGFGFVTCPTAPADAQADGETTPDVLCKPEEARYHVPYTDELVDEFLEQEKKAAAQRKEGSAAPDGAAKPRRPKAGAMRRQRIKRGKGAPPARVRPNPRLEKGKAGQGGAPKQPTHGPGDGHGHPH